MRVAPLYSFRDRDGRACRVFQASLRNSAIEAVACREAGNWRLAALAPAAPQTDRFSQAGADDAQAIESAVDALGPTEITSVEERALIARRWAAELKAGKGSDADIDRLGEAVALAYPDRIAQARPSDPGQFRLAGGRGAVIALGDPLASQPYLAVAEVGGEARHARIYLAAPISRAAIEARARCLRFGHVNSRREKSPMLSKSSTPAYAMAYTTSVIK